MKSAKKSSDDVNSASSLVGEKKGKKKTKKQSLAEARKVAELWHINRAKAKGREPSENVQDNEDENSTSTTDSPVVSAYQSFFSKKDNVIKEKIVKKSYSRPPTSTVVEKKSSKPAVSKKEKLAEAKLIALNWHVKRIEGKEKTSAENYKFLRTPHFSSKASCEAEGKEKEDYKITSARDSREKKSSFMRTPHFASTHFVSKKHCAELDSGEEAESDTESEMKEHLPVTSTRSQIKWSLLIWMLAIILAFGAVSEVCNSIGSFVNMGFTALDKITSKPVPKTFENSFVAKQGLKMKDDPSSLQEHHVQIKDSAEEKYLTKVEANYNVRDTAPQSCTTSCPDQLNLLQDAYISGMKESNSVALGLDQIWWTVGFVILAAAAAVVFMSIALFERYVGRKVHLKPREAYKMTSKAASDASEDFIVLE
eukprot:scaffold71309_cov38-Attheya_sp.AAC.1